MSEVNKWGLGLMLMVLIFEVRVLGDTSLLILVLSALIAGIGFGLFVHEKKQK